MGIHKATRGIPRRINTVCDRLLLLGFLAGRSELTAADVQEVVGELEQEAALPKPRDAVTRPDASSSAPMDLDVDVAKLQTEPSLAEGVGKQLARLSAEQRLERSLLRLERLNVQTLSLMQRLVAAVQRTDTDAPEPTEDKPASKSPGAAKK